MTRKQTSVAAGCSVLVTSFGEILCAIKICDLDEIWCRENHTLKGVKWTFYHIYYIFVQLW